MSFELSSDEPRELGTLVVVVGKARNLVNKSRFGKQDPFCTLSMGENKHKTKSVKRGGQNPEWDEELRFKIIEDTEDVIARLGGVAVADNLNSSTSSVTKTDSPGVTTAQALASKSRKGPMNKKSGKSIRLAVFADDAKEPELIGESYVPIDDVLKKGEIDEWYDLQYKDKYSGEVYLELTFFSNDAPPVKRNVPRPSVPGHVNTLSGGGLSHSGSVSGMSLYIPPYVKSVPSAAPVSPALGSLPISASVPSLAPSSSFANLGLPPARHQTPLPAQPPYPPQPQRHGPSHADRLSIDSLTRPMSSMSLSPSAGNLALPQQSQTVSGQHHIQRHSMSGEAPWGSLLPQSQPRQSHVPLPRPMSSNDAVPWEQAQRLADQRQQGAGATPVPRPLSGIGHRGSTPVPLVPNAAPPVHHHANSFSGPSHTQGRYPTPAAEILHPNSAPPVAATNQYNAGPASFHSIIATLSEQARPGSTAPHQQYGQQPDPYATPTSGYQKAQEYPSQQPQYGTPTRHGSYPYSAPQQQQVPLPTPPRDPHGQQGYPQAQQQYQDNQSPQPVSAGQPTPAPQAVGYVPWYQQTQPQQPSRPPATETPLPGSYPASTYAAPGPPPVPSHRPVPNPPAPPKTGVGYYPSDELYVQEQKQQQQQQQQPPLPAFQTQVNQAPWQQQQPNGYTAQPYGQQPPQSQPYVPTQTPVQAPWQQPQHPQYGYLPSSTPVPQSHTPQPYQPDPNVRQSSPAPPLSHTPQPYGQQQQQSYDRQPSPAHIQQQPSSLYAQQVAASYAQPQNHSAPAGWQPTIPQAAQGYPQDQPQQRPQQLAQPYVRSASPQPPPPQHSSYPPQPLQPSHSQSSLPSTPQQSLVPHGIHGASPAAPARSPSPAPSPYGTPSGPSKGRPDWKSYMQSLSVGTSPAGVPIINGRPVSPARTPSPQPPPKDWYTPPPSVPSSIGKPPGWRSSLPQDSPGHQWRP